MARQNSPVSASRHADLFARFLCSDGVSHTFYAEAGGCRRCSIGMLSQAARELQLRHTSRHHGSTDTATESFTVHTREQCAAPLSKHLTLIFNVTVCGPPAA